ncbi:response regulator transcription factor [Oceaniglobus trochenteri]|uniref:response regulator transcription factor n=1 Tax=Oceaniglobus trochenteri TaxID=2763260 RepID=UPI001CFF5BDF|nr:response regulator transcription factor [Oceaniglobus trochenteri]
MIKRVLLIEDEPNIIEAVRYILSRDGWAVDTHADGASAMAAVLRRVPDVIVLDAMLPGRSGFDILRDLRAHADPAIAAIPVLMLTARGQQKDRDMAERSGANRFMTKPFSNAEMLACVQSLLAAPTP